MNQTISINIPYPTESDSESLITKSNVFRGMQYEVRDGKLIIYTLQNGVLAIPLRHVGLWADELQAIGELWDGIRT